MSIALRINHTTVDVLGMDPLRDESFDAIRRITAFTIYVVSDSDARNLPLIANNAYGSPDMWWAILMYNEVSDVFAIPAGYQLKIPNYSQLIHELSEIRTKSNPNEIVEL